jgi:hypothetical protein
MLTPERYTEIRRSKGRSLEGIGTAGWAFAKVDALAGSHDTLWVSWALEPSGW